MWVRWIIRNHERPPIVGYHQSEHHILVQLSLLFALGHHHVADGAGGCVQGHVFVQEGLQGGPGVGGNSFGLLGWRDLGGFVCELVANFSHEVVHQCRSCHVRIPAGVRGRLQQRTSKNRELHRSREKPNTSLIPTLLDHDFEKRPWILFLAKIPNAQIGPGVANTLKHVQRHLRGVGVVAPLQIPLVRVRLELPPILHPSLRHFRKINRGREVLQPRALQMGRVRALVQPSPRIHSMDPVIVRSDQMVPQQAVSISPVIHSQRKSVIDQPSGSTHELLFPWPHNGLDVGDTKRRWRLDRLVDRSRLRVALRVAPQIATQLATPGLLQGQGNLSCRDTTCDVVEGHAGIHPRRSGSEDLEFQVLVEADELPQLSISVLTHEHVLLVLGEIQAVQVDELLQVPGIRAIRLDCDTFLALHQIQSQQQWIATNRGWQAQLVLLGGEHRARHGEERLHGCLGHHLTR
mmetsp:Transcript_40679/g.97560  ORF Transcript_40679/g.97560 Transcript_40679/m.97560 type:complete len:463 (-) Transcript_40679:735-2123(-)